MINPKTDYLLVSTGMMGMSPLPKKAEWDIGFVDFSLIRFELRLPVNLFISD